MTFDRKVFSSADLFTAEMWRESQPYWMLVKGVKVGCCAFEHDVDSGDSSLYISTTGILPRFQGKGFGLLLKAWQISYARNHGFTRILTHTRRRNRAMINLNRKFGFRVIRTIPRYYADPTDAAVVMELRLGRKQRSHTAR